MVTVAGLPGPAGRGRPLVPEPNGRHCRIKLPYSKTAVQISTEPVYAIDGTPRWELEPDVVVKPLGRTKGNDAFIAAAIEETRTRSPAAR